MCLEESFFPFTREALIFRPPKIYCNDPAVSASSQVHYRYLFIADLCII